MRILPDLVSIKTMAISTSFAKPVTDRKPNGTRRQGFIANRNEFNVLANISKIAPLINKQFDEDKIIDEPSNHSSSDGDDYFKMGRPDTSHPPETNRK